jgi:hypothetical protein
VGSAIGRRCIANVRHTPGHTEFDQVGFESARRLPLRQNRTQDTALGVTSFSTRGLDVRPGFTLAYPMKERSIEIRYDDRGAEETRRQERGTEAG